MIDYFLSSPWFFYTTKTHGTAVDHHVSGPTALGLWSIYHHVGDAQLCRCSQAAPEKRGLQRHDLLRQPGEEVPDMTSPDFPEYGSRRCPGGLGGWCNSKDFLPEMLASKKVPRYSITVFKDELINSGNQLKQFPGNPCIFIAFFELKNMTCRKGRIAEYIREMDDLVENFGPGWGFGEWNRRCVFFAFFCFGEDLHIPLAFGAIAGFWTCFLAVYLNVVFWASECPVARIFLFFLPSPYLQSLRFRDGLRTFQGCYILFGSVSVFLLSQPPRMSWKLNGKKEVAEDQSTSCWLYILCPSFSAFFRGTEELKTVRHWWAR